LIVKKLAANIQVKTEREFVLAMVKTGIFIPGFGVQYFD